VRNSARAAALAGLLALWLSLAGHAQAANGPWLFVTDIHLDPVSKSTVPSPLGRDTNEVLFGSALAEMRRVDPNPPVVFITGDFLAHGFEYRLANPTMAQIAHRFGAAFPHAQFVIALGNEDSNCADYTLTTNSEFLRTTADLWAPLVNRHGAAPDFRRTFPRDGFYVTKLPLSNVRAVVLDDVFWSPRYRAACGPRGGDGVADSVGDLMRALPVGRAGKNWVVMHIPPGIDAFSTVHLAHHLAVVPFLNPGPRNQLNEVLGDPRRHVSLVVAAHIHKFSYRVMNAARPDPLPMLLVPAVSPIFRNNASFLTVDVAPDGTIRNAEDHSYVDYRWRDIGGLHSLGVRAVTGKELLALQRRLDADPALRARYAALYNGDAPPEINDRNWMGYACASIAFGVSEYRDCMGERGYSLFTRRGLTVVGAGLLGAACVLAVLAACLAWMLRRKRRSTGSG
jgi:Calcineurin-like phosphoesterase